MAVKSQIIAELGEPDLLAPERIAQSLTANDQVKYYFALLQMARSNADRPTAPVRDLKGERMACQIDDVWLDDVVAEARKRDGGAYLIPRSAEIVERIYDAITRMVDCLPADTKQSLEARVSQLSRPEIREDEIAGSVIDSITSGDKALGDSLHLVVMEAHRAINRLQAETAVETLAGARVHSLSKRSRKLVEAFMSGLNQTAPLKFDHPGLGTTATEHNGRTLIQNDIGTTDAHVLVLRIDGRIAVLTYTDIHRQRLKFFQSLFSDFSVSWENADMRSSANLESKSYLLTTGTYVAENEADLFRYLAHLGSRIVFLIDWNKMRKRLRGFVGKELAIDVIRWAARHDLGHRALLEVGGEVLLGEAVEYAAGQTLRYGDRLDTLIGEDNAEAFLRRAFEIASLGLQHGRSRRIIADEIKTELTRHFETSRQAIFGIAAQHAACGFDLAVTLRESLEHTGTSARTELARTAERAILWEARADQLLNVARSDMRRFERPASLGEFFAYADDAVDELEEAASVLELLTLIPVASEPLSELRSLADLALASAQELVKCVECAATITRSDVRDDFDDFLESLDRLIALEHRADIQLRSMRRALLTAVDEPRAIYLLDQVARSLEAATDAYAHSGQSLRTYLMDEVLS